MRECIYNCFVDSLVEKLHILITIFEDCPENVFQKRLRQPDLNGAISSLNLFCFFLMANRFFK